MKHSIAKYSITKHNITKYSITKHSAPKGTLSEVLSGVILHMTAISGQKQLAIICDSSYNMSQRAKGQEGMAHLFPDPRPGGTQA